MKRILCAFSIFAFSIQAIAQERSLPDSVSWDWLDLYYPGDTVLTKKLLDFYELLDHPLNALSVEHLYREQDELHYWMRDSINIEYTDYKKYENDTEDAIQYFSDKKMPGFVFGCAAECTMFDATVNYNLILEACKKTKSAEDDSAMAIIIDIWGMVPNHPSFQLVECCACRGTNDLGSGLQYKLLKRIKAFTSKTSLFGKEMNELKQMIKRHILWNDGYRHTRASILKELELVKSMLEFNERELIALKRAETKIAENVYDDPDTPNH